MAATLSAKALAGMLRQLQQEKEERLQKEAAEEQRKLDLEEEEQKRALAQTAAKKKDLSDKLRREEEDLKKLRRAVLEHAANAEEEQRIHALRRRIEDFRGNDDFSLHSRLIAEGYTEQLIIDMLRLRTLEQKVENETGPKATWSHLEPVKQQNPLERVMYGSPSFRDITDRNVLDRLDHIRREAADNGYLAERERAFVQTVEYHTNRFQEHPVYSAQGSSELRKASRTVEDIKKEIGLTNPWDVTHPWENTYKSK